MKIVRQIEAVAIANSATCTAYEYATNTPTVNVARVVVTGRYPEEGWARNTAVDEVVYVAEGQGHLQTEGSSHSLSPGDVVSIQKGEAVAWEGTLTLIIAAAPAWYPEQYEHQS